MAKVTGARNPSGAKKPIGAKKLRRRVNMYPPYLGAGVRVKHVSEDFRSIEVEMPLRWWNKNLVGTHFGGSLYSMCDPFYMIMLIHNLGPDYVVWDKAATIRFKKPGKGLMRAKFELTKDRVEEIRTAADHGEKVEPMFQVVVRDAEENVVAEVDKLLWVRKRKG
ncbi:MAG: DUF4442 domain-containing protein [Candidatus Acidiferrales bacterium]